MNFSDSAVPVLWRLLFAVAIPRYSFHRDGEAISLKKLYGCLETRRLSTIHFNPQLPKFTVLPREGPFAIRS